MWLVSNVQQNDTSKEVLKRVLNTRTADQWTMLGLICWSIWCRRNKWVWDKINLSVFGVRALAMNLLADWNRAKEKSIKHLHQQSAGKQHWGKPPVGWIKVNVDASWRRGDDFIGVGCVMRDDWGKFLQARSSRIRGKMQPKMAEALSLREALSWTIQWRTKKCIFECDAKLVVDAVNWGRGKSMFDMIVEDSGYLNTIGKC